ncbi:MAG: hypothetical protein OXI12_06665 [Gammaproteobacteria bacterium]|nr:hypothetical protein [Gammaproteobacteria bacterium]
MAPLVPHRPYHPLSYWLVVIEIEHRPVPSDPWRRRFRWTAVDPDGRQDQRWGRWHDKWS